MQTKTSKKDKFYCFLAWALCLCLLAVLFFSKNISHSYRATTYYFLETIGQEKSVPPAKHLLYEGSFYASGSYFYSSTTNEQLVYLSGDSLYHKNNRCTYCHREACALMYYSALLYFPQLSPCPLCSWEDMVY